MKHRKKYPSILLSLSSFRFSEKAVETAFDLADQNSELCVLWVIDVNLSRYLVGLDSGLSYESKEMFYHELHEKFLQIANGNLEKIIEKAQDFKINITTEVVIGRFAIESLRVAHQKKPMIIVTTRSNRAQWLIDRFGSPVKVLTEQSDCPVIVV